MFLTPRSAFRVREIILVIQAGDNLLSGLAVEVTATQKCRDEDLVLLAGDIKRKQTALGTVQST